MLLKNLQDSKDSIFLGGVYIGKCVDNKDGQLNLTKGNEYKIQKISFKNDMLSYWLVENNNGDIEVVNEKRFKVL